MRQRTLRRMQKSTLGRFVLQNVPWKHSHKDSLDVITWTFIVAFDGAAEFLTKSYVRRLGWMMKVSRNKKKKVKNSPCGGSSDGWEEPATATSSCTITSVCSIFLASTGCDEWITMICTIILPLNQYCDERKEGDYNRQLRASSHYLSFAYQIIT